MSRALLLTCFALSAASHARAQGLDDPSGLSTSAAPAAPADSPASGAQRADVFGRLALRTYASDDSGGAQSFNSPFVSISFLETDLRGRDLTSGGLALDLDATFILDISQANERRFGETERLDQVRHLSVSQPIGALTLSFGRRLLFYAGNAWVDGLEARYALDGPRLAIGAYAGLSPDRFDRSLTLDYQAAGAYVDLARAGLDLSAAYNVILKGGQLDRHFVYQRAHIKLAEGLFVSDYAILDLALGTDLTTFLATIDYTPTEVLNFTLNLSQYSLERYRDQTIYRNIIEPNQALILGNEVLNLVYRRARLSGSLRFKRTLYHYQSIEYKWRAQDGRDALIYTLGVRNEDLFGSGVELDGQTQLMRGFRADTLIFALTARKDLSAHLSVDARLTRFTGRTLDLNETDRLRLFDEAQTIYLMGVSLNTRLTQRHHLAVSYDGVYEAEVADLKSDEPLMIHTGSLRYTFLY